MDSPLKHFAALFLQNIATANQTRSNLAYKEYWTKPNEQKLLVKAVNAWVRSAFGNVFNPNHA